MDRSSPSLLSSRSTRKTHPFLRSIRLMFGFNPLPVSLLVVIIYGFIVYQATSIQLEQNPNLNGPQVPGIYQAWKDLQEISRSFHPYNSHANDIVHEYVLDQIKEAMANTSRKVEIDADIMPLIYSAPDVFDKSIPSNKVSYFEANNILVRIEGSNAANKSAVLLSSHFDSVPTSHGTTDDGVGIASMLGILRHILSSSEEELFLDRPIIFNFNNDEEFGLRGAEAFVRHEWWKDVETFINLEGMGAGGRALLFRTTDYEVGKHYKAVKSPHGNSVIQQGFQTTSAISSETDYKVYSREGARGLDIAFYRPRTIYHTRRDATSESNIQSLAHMMGSALDTLVSLANAESYGDKETAEPAVYFDLFGKYFFITSVNTFQIYNVLGVVVGPVLLIGLFVVAVRTGRYATTIPMIDLSSSLSTTPNSATSITRGWGRFLLSFLVSIFVVITEIHYTNVYNRYIFFSNLVVPLWTYIFSFVIINYVFLKVAAHIRPVHDQKLIIIIELCAIFWVLMLKVTFDSYQGLAGEYFVTVIYYSLLAASVVGILGHLLWASKEVVIYKSIPTEESDDGLTESSPLLNGVEGEALESGDSMISQSGDEKFHGFDWIIQLLIIVPLSLAILYSVFFVILDASRTSISDSSTPATIFTYLITGTVILIGSLIIPFIDKLHPMIVLFLTVFSLYGAHTLSYFPFTTEVPLKLRNVQSINLDVNPPELLSISRGLPGYNRQTVADIPGVHDLNCSVAYSSNLETCSYRAPRPWILDHKPDFQDWFNISISEPRSGTGPFHSNVDIYAPQCRSFLMTFRTASFKSRDPTSKYPSPVRRITVFHGDYTDTPTSSGWSHSPEKDSYHSLDGIDDFSFLHLDWERDTHHIGIEWIPRWIGETIDDDLTLEVQCYWGEYDNVSYVDGQLHRFLPALDDLLEYSPNYITWANLEEGLLKIKKSIVL